MSGTYQLTTMLQAPISLMAIFLADECHGAVEEEAVQEVLVPSFEVTLEVPESPKFTTDDKILMRITANDGSENAAVPTEFTSYLCSKRTTDGSHNILYARRDGIHVNDKNSRGKGLSSIMVAIQTLYMEEFLKTKDLNTLWPEHDSYEYTELYSTGSAVIHYHHGFTPLATAEGTNEWHPANEDNWADFEYKGQRGPKALIQVFEDIKTCKDEFEGGCEYLLKNFLHKYGDKKIREADFEPSVYMIMYRPTTRCREKGWRLDNIRTSENEVTFEVRRITTSGSMLKATATLKVEVKKSPPASDNSLHELPTDSEDD